MQKAPPLFQAHPFNGTQACSLGKTPPHPLKPACQLPYRRFVSRAPYPLSSWQAKRDKRGTLQAAEPQPDP